MNIKKQIILDYCKKEKRPVTAKEIINAMFPGKQQPYINTDIVELVNNGELIRDDSCRPYTIRLPHENEEIPPVKDYSRKKSNCPNLAKIKTSNSKLPQDFKNSFNQFWAKMFNLDIDYYDQLNFDDLVQLKIMVSKVNNLLTYELSLLVSDQISSIIKLSTTQKQALKNKIEITDLNANGFDIEYNHNPHFICEIKSTLPPGGKKRFGAAQDREIRKDIDGLLNGKEKSQLTYEDLESYYKFMCFYNYNSTSIQAVNNLIERLQKENYPIELWCGQRNLSFEKIYVLLVAPEEISINK